MPFQNRRHARASAILVFVMLAPALATLAKDTNKKLSTYDAIVVEPVIIAPAATKNFPAGLEDAIRGRMIDELRKKKVFQDVQDQAPPLEQKPATNRAPGPSAANGEPSGQQIESPRIILSTTVLQFSKGNMAARAIIGFGAGESKITLRFVLRDSATGSELMQFEQKASYTGDMSFTGGTPSEAARGAANGAVKGLIKEIQKNR